MGFTIIFRAGETFIQLGTSIVSRQGEKVKGCRLFYEIGRPSATIETADTETLPETFETGFVILYKKTIKNLCAMTNRFFSKQIDKFSNIGYTIIVNKIKQLAEGNVGNSIPLAFGKRTMK